MKKVFAMVLAVMILCSMLLVPVYASSSSELGTNKAVYLEGELVDMYYKFPSTNSNRYVWVYKDTDLQNPIKIFAATGLSGTGFSNLWYPENKPFSAGTYIMKVTDKDGNPISNLTATFTIQPNPSLTRRISISLDKTTYDVDDTIIVSYDGVTDSLPYDKIVQITFYDELDIPASETPIYLWDTREYIGISGELDIDIADMDLMPGSYYAILESNDASMDLSYSRVDFTVVDSSAATEAPATKAPATEAPATEAPATKAPATDAPATKAPATDAPATKAPATDAPATDAPATDAPATDAPATDAPATDAPATDAPATDAPATDAPEKDSDGGNNTVLWVVGIVGVLLVGAAVVAVILLKKKK